MRKNLKLCLFNYKILLSNEERTRSLVELFFNNYVKLCHNIFKIMFAKFNY